VAIRGHSWIKLFLFLSVALVAPLREIFFHLFILLFRHSNFVIRIFPMKSSATPSRGLFPLSPRRLLFFAFYLSLFTLYLYPSAGAHIIPGEPVSFAAGWDHIIAMVGVGIWGAQIGRPAIWLLPVTFPVVMSFGGFLGLCHVPVPGGEHNIEYGIAISGLLLGIMILCDVHPASLAAHLFKKDDPATALRKGKKLGYTLAITMVGFFGLCHGYAHGNELPANDSGLYYSIGFVIATGTLHACGIVIGLIHRWPAGQIALRVAGAAIACGGIFFLHQDMQPETPEAPATAAFASPFTSAESRTIA
jgi:urease accessory protein